MWNFFSLNHKNDNKQITGLELNTDPGQHKVWLMRDKHMQNYSMSIFSEKEKP